MINHKRAKEIKIDPVRVRQLIEEMESYHIDLKTLSVQQKTAG